MSRFGLGFRAEGSRFEGFFGFTGLGFRVQEFLLFMQHDSTRDWMQRRRLGKQLAETLAQHARFCCVAFLLQLEKVAEVCIQDVQWFVEYSGPLVWNNSIKSFLKKPEPQGSNWRKLKQDSREYLPTLYMEAERTAAISRALVLGLRV